jgi:hypothetical protein
VILPLIYRKAIRFAIHDLPPEELVFLFFYLYLALSAIDTIFADIQCVGVEKFAVLVSLTIEANF